MTEPTTAATLKAMLAGCGDAHAEASRIRPHRAISWLARAEAEASNYDARFVFLWIAFNAAYARELALEGSAREQLDTFLIARTRARCRQAHRGTAAQAVQRTDPHGGGEPLRV